MTGHLEHDSIEPTREDVLIGRVADGEASPLDWSELEQIGARDSGVWERLARAQRAHARLTCAVEDSIAVADLVELPAISAAPSWATRAYQYGGWAIAAMVAVSWIGLNLFSNSPTRPARDAGPGQSQLASGASNGSSPEVIPAGWSSEEAFNQYLNAGMAQGRVISEMPTVYVEARPLQSGQGYELVFVRQILERKTVNDLQFLDLSQNEQGQPVYVPANKPTMMNGQTY